MRKVVFIHLFNDRSGSPAVLAQVIRVVQSSGMDADLYTGKQLPDGVLSGLVKKHFYTPYYWVKNKYLHFTYYFLSQLVLFFQLFQYRNQDVIIYVNTLMPFGAALAGKLMGKKIIYHLHETSFRPIWLKKFLRGVIRLTAHKIIFVSEALLKTDAFPSVPQVVIPNSLSDDFFLEARQSMYAPIKNGFFSVLMVCSLKKYKGVCQFLELAQRCLGNRGIRFELVLNAEITEIELFFKGMNIPENLRVHSRQKNLSQFYRGASLVLNLSLVDQWIETFGLTVLEALSYGVPVIVPPTGGPAEVVRNGRDGFLIDAYEMDKLSRLVQDLALDEDFCRELSAHARERANDFSPRTFAEQIQNEIEHV